MFRKALLLACLVISMCAIPASGLGMRGGGAFDLAWHSLDAGGGTSSGGSFSLHGVIGQPDAGAPGAMTGGAFDVSGGFLVNTTDPCPADTDDSGVVDVTDLLALLGAWGSCPGCPADTNNDGVVDVTDLLGLLGAWGACP